MFTKITVGIDVAKKELVTCIIGLTHEFETLILGRKKFDNSPEGISSLYRWALKLAADGPAPEFVMEATGVYHIALANYVADKSACAGVILPNKISNYMRTLVLKTINDDTSSECIAEYGVRHKITPWVKPDEDLLGLRDLMRERQACIDQRTIAKNQLHAAKIAHGKESSKVNRLQNQIKLFNEQIKEIETEARKLVKENPFLHKKVKNVITIPGVSYTTAYTIIGETLGFNMVKSSRQLVSFAGLDIKTKESGTSVRGKERISKKGNKHIRKALYFPAFTAVKHNPDMSELYQRLVSKQGIRMKAAVAVQRKVLVLIYAIWKSDQPFDQGYELTKAKKSGAHC